MISLLEYHGIKKTYKEIDFLPPFLDLDRKYFLDPSLLKFPPSARLKEWDQEILDFLDLIRHIIRSGNRKKLEKILSIGEARDAGLGYCAEGISGSGVGNEISTNIIKILDKNEEFKNRGLLRLEELQWFDLNIGPDRISDLAINILKRHIIKYTQQQCRLNGIPMEDVRIRKVFYPDTLEWGLLKTKLPINPMITVQDAINPYPPVLLMPKEALKTLPLFLNYNDFYGFIERKVKKKKREPRKPKILVMDEFVREPSKSTRYIHYREGQHDKLYRFNFDNGIHRYVEELDIIKPGREQANDYQRVVAKLFNFIFDDLEIYKEEKSTLLQDRRRDIIFQNNARSGIFSDLKHLFRASHIVVDAKNKKKITAKDISRVADYLDDDIGRVGFIVSRKKSDLRLLKHANTQLVKHKKVLLFISDEELKKWARGKTRIKHVTGEAVNPFNPLKAISNKYSDLVSS